MTTAIGRAPNRAARMPGRARGFTLLELLVAMMILTLFFAASMGAVRLGSRSLEAGHRRANASEQMRVSADFLRRQFARMPAITWSDGREKRLAFLAGQDKLVFVAPSPRFSRGAGMLVYTLAAERNGSDYALTLGYAPFDPGNDVFTVPAASERQTLASGFDSIVFEYYGAETDEDEPAWMPNWRPDAEHYPLAIRLRASGNSWPVLIFKLRSAEAS